MVLLVLAAGLVIIGVVWFLLRPLDARNEAVARRYELTAVRDRLIAQLDEWDAERTDQGVDAQVAGTEQRRLEFELAQVGRPGPEKVSAMDAGFSYPGAAADGANSLRPATASGIDFVCRR